MPKTFRDVIAIWNTPDELAIEIGRGIYAVRNWRARDKIPPEYWLDVVAAARARKARGVTLKALATIAASRAA